MKIINKADKYGEENKDYTLMIGDADIVLTYKNKMVWAFNFQTHIIQGFNQKNCPMCDEEK